MEESVAATTKKKPVFAAFWDRRKDHSSSSSSSSSSNQPTSRNTAPASEHHAQGADPSSSQTSLSSTSSATATSSNSVQRLIQQYSGTAANDRSRSISPIASSSTKSASSSAQHLPSIASASTSHPIVAPSESPQKEAQRRRRSRVQEQTDALNHATSDKTLPALPRRETSQVISGEEDSESNQHLRQTASSPTKQDLPSRGRLDQFYDARARVSTPKDTADPPVSLTNRASDPAAQILPPASPEDTRPWLEFSPLMPESETIGAQQTPCVTATALGGMPTTEVATSSSRSSSAGPSQTHAMYSSSSRSTSATTQSTDSPISPTGLGFSHVPASSSNSSIVSHGSSSSASGLRSHRLSKLPPPLPSPSTPLPPPPPSRIDTDVPCTRSSRSQSNQPSPSSSRNDSPSDSINDATLRARSQSLEQGATSAELSEGRSSSLLSLPSVQQRGASLQSGSESQSSPALPSPTPSSASTLLSPDSAAHRGETTLRNSRPPPGRPRGFTVGAVPSSSGLSSNRGSAQLLPSFKIRPRSLLSNEIFPGLDLAQSQTSSETRPRLSMHLNGMGTRSAPNVEVPSSMSSHNESSTSRSAIASTTRKSFSGTSQNEPSGSGTDVSDRRPSVSTRSRSASSASLLQQVNSQPKSHASFVIAVVGHAQAGKSTVIKRGLHRFGLSDPHVLSEKVTSHSTICMVDQEQRTIEVLEIDASVLLYGPSKRFAWPKFLPHIDAVILCYDAADISSFRGMSELLENFAIADLSTVILACKSEILPKAVDPYYASDMACVWNVGLAECTTQSDEGKKRMRDCFSYLVREVAKARSGRSRRKSANIPAIPPVPTPMKAQRSLSPGTRQSVPPIRTLSGHSKDSSLTNSLRSAGDSPARDPDTSADDVESPRGSLSLIRERDLSDTSLVHDQEASSGSQSNDGSMIRSPVDATSPTAFDTASPMQQQTQHSAARGQDGRSTSRKMSSATVASVMSEAPSIQSDDEVILRENLVKAQLGLNVTRSAGGYVSIDELWDKVFHAAVSRTDERFVTTFMVFYRGFATPQDLLTQIAMRFDALTQQEVAEGLMHRFALIRLANMLADWVQDYPGDLCHPETHAMLVSLHRRLLQHRDTIHTAVRMRAAVEATAFAVDKDAVWSRSVDTGRTQPETDGAGGLSSSGLNHTVPAMMSHSVPNLAARTPVEDLASEGGLPVAPEGNRSRSVSEVTTSSTEDVSSPITKTSTTKSLGGTSSKNVGSNGRSFTTSHPSHAANASSSSGAPSIGSTQFDTMSSNDQRIHVRTLSNMLMEADDEDIATELTRLEWIYFTAIQPRDLLRHILVPHEQRDGPVAKSISHFNYISNWVCSMILMQSKAKHRARMLEKFYNIAAVLRHDNNYGSLNSVLAGLSKTAVHRLKQTRELLKGRPVNKAYQSLVRLMSNERSSAAYRLALENSEGLTIPYVGVHLQDILSISDGNPSKRASDGMIHWRKFSLMDEAVMAVARCQQYDRFIRPNFNVERLIVDVPILDDDLLYERSLEVEPRSQTGPTNATSKIKDLKTFLSNTASSSNSSYHS